MLELVNRPLEQALADLDRMNSLDPADKLVSCIDHTALILELFLKIKFLLFCDMTGIIFIGSPHQGIEQVLGTLKQVRVDAALVVPE